MGNAKHYWQKVLQTIDRFAMPHTRKLARELSAVVDKNQSLTVELESVRNEFESARIRDRNLEAEIGQRISDLEAERDTAHQQLHDLKTLLTGSSTLQESTATQVRQLESKLEEEYTKHESMLQTMHGTLTQVQNKQQTFATQATRLESRLEEEYAKHDSLLETMHGTLTQVQNKQQTLLEFQSDLDDSVRKTRLYLLDVIRNESVKPRTHVFAMVVVAVFFLLNTIAGAASFWMFRQDLLELSAMTNDLKLIIKEHISKHEVALTEQPTQKDAQGLGDVTNIFIPGHSSKLDKPDQDHPDTQRAGEEAGQSGETDTQPVTLSNAEKDFAQRELSESERPGNEFPKWGPPLLLQSTDNQGNDSTPEFDPLVKELQSNLMVLGFDLGRKGADGIKGAHTEQALQEFQLLYETVFGVQQGMDSSDLAAFVRRFAELAREDEQKYKINSAVLAAIRLSNLRTGVDFSFLMELAAAESAFDSGSRAAKSSATGLYQFKDDTWLETVKRHGEEYGIGNYASQVEFFVDTDGNSRPMISDPVIYRHVLDLRHNPRIAALMAAEHLKDNMRQLSSSLDQELGRTEMYLTHFLGASGAITFLEILGKNPDKLAGDIFPGPASRNMNIFHTKKRKPRTVAEVYKVLGRKFGKSRYKDWLAN